jgi:PIN domain nuclease of toxin-antitoxin system
LRHFQDANNTCYLSSVSSWEIAVLASLGRMQFHEPVERYVVRMRRRLRIRPLRLLESATLIVGRLPWIHRDPFDRMLICQAISHGMTLLTPDALIARYAVPVLW